MGRTAIPPGGTGEIRARQVKDRLWSARVRWRDDAGEYHRTTVEASTKKQCEDLAAQRVREAREALRTPSVSDLRLDEVAERWFAALERSSRRPSTNAQYRATWRGTLSPVLGQDGINSITRARIQQVLLDGLFARNQGHRGEDGSWIAGTYRHDKNGDRVPLRGEQPRNVMRQLLRFAADRGYRSDGINVLDGTESPERRIPEVRALTDDEAVRLIAMALEWHRTGHGASDVLWHGLVVMRVTGLRIGELVALRWCDVDLEADPPTISAEHTLLEQRGDVGGLGPTKGDTTDVIALHESAATVLVDRHSRGARPESFVFATRSGKPVTQANFRRSLRNLVRDTDLSWVHPHSLRKTLATKAEGVHDIDAARDLLRHKDSQVTRRHYVERNDVRILDPRGLFEDDR